MGAERFPDLTSCNFETSLAVRRMATGLGLVVSMASCSMTLAEAQEFCRLVNFNLLLQLAGFVYFKKFKECIKGLYLQTLSCNHGRCPTDHCFYGMSTPHNAEVLFLAQLAIITFQALYSSFGSTLFNPNLMLIKNTSDVFQIYYRF